jgi:hypothetical protein
MYIKFDMRREPLSNLVFVKILVDKLDVDEPDDVKLGEVEPDIEQAFEPTYGQVACVCNV